MVEVGIAERDPANDDSIVAEAQMSAREIAVGGQRFDIAIALIVDDVDSVAPRDDQRADLLVHAGIRVGMQDTSDVARFDRVGADGHHELPWRRAAAFDRPSPRRGKVLAKPLGSGGAEYLGGRANGWEEWQHWDRSFHLNLVAATHNRLAIGVYDAVIGIRHERPWLKIKQGHTDAIFWRGYQDEHRRIAAALAARDAASAAEAIRDHLTKVRFKMLGI
jgi:hypothetical protein